MRIAAEEGTATTLEAIAAKLGQDPHTIGAVGRAAGLTFLSGFSDAVKPAQPHIAAGPGGPAAALAAGRDQVRADPVRSDP